MKKHISIFILLFASILFCQSQQTLTFREVFDFSIGDEFHYQMLIMPDIVNTFDGTENYFVDKVLSRNNYIDSIVYEFSRIRKFRYMRPVQHTVDTVIYKLTITNLDTSISKVNLTIPFFGYPSSIMVVCPNPCDSSYFTDSSFLSQDYIIRNSTRVEFNGLAINKMQFVRKMGLVDYFRSADLSIGRDRHTIKLFYYKDAQSGEEWGTKLNMVGIRELNRSPKVQIYPNPILDFVTILIEDYLDSDNYKVEVNSLDGKKVYSTTVYSEESFINLSELALGIYTVSIINKNGNTGNRFLISKN